MPLFDSELFENPSLFDDLPWRWDPWERLRIF